MSHILSRYCVVFSAIFGYSFFFFQAEDGIRDVAVTGVQTCALPISRRAEDSGADRDPHDHREPVAEAERALEVGHASGGGMCTENERGAAGYAPHDSQPQAHYLVPAAPAPTTTASCAAASGTR